MLSHIYLFIMLKVARSVYISMSYKKKTTLFIQIKTTSQTNAKLKKKYVHVYEHELL